MKDRIRENTFLRVKKGLGRPGVLSVLIFLACFVLSLIFSSNRHVPIVWADEMGYIGIARYLSGAWPMVNMGETAFYHFGYPIIIAPLFLLFDNMSSIYTAGIIINDLMVGFIAYITFHISRRITNDLRLAFLVSVIAILYPSVLLNAGLLWSETIFSLVFIALIHAAFRIVERPCFARAMSLILLAVAAYAIHPRGIALPAISVVLVMYLTWQKRLSYLTFIASLITTVCFWAAIVKLNEHILEAGWVRSNWSLLTSIIGSLLTVDGLINMTLSLMRQIWYFTVSSFGILPICIVLLVKSLWAGKHDFLDRNCRSNNIIFIFSLLAFSSILFASSAQMLVPARLDHYIYGRYVAATLPAMFAIGLPAIGFVTNTERTWKFSLALIIAMGVFAGFVVAHVPNADGNLAIFNAPMVAIGFDYTDLPNATLRLSLISITVFALFVLLRSMVGVHAILGMAALAMLLSSLVVRRDFDVYAHGVRQRTAKFRQLHSGPVSAVVAYDLDTAPIDLFYHYQMYKFGWKFLGYHSKSQEPPKASILIMGRPFTLPQGGGPWTPVMFDDQVDVVVLSDDPGSFDSKMRENNLFGGNLMSSYLPSVSMDGFYQVERSGDVLWRWTNGDGSVSFDTGSAKACGIQATLVSASASVDSAKIILSGQELLSVPLALGVARNIDLKHSPFSGPVKIELLSDTFAPGGADDRTLGIMVRSLSLTECDLRSY